VRRAVTVVRKRPALPLPRILDPRARRRGGRVVVTWRTAVPARRVAFAAILSLRRKPGGSVVVGVTYGAGGGRRRHRLVLDARNSVPSALPRGRWVLLFADSPDSSHEFGPLPIRVTRG
jgi:hypothetical protein